MRPSSAGQCARPAAEVRPADRWSAVWPAVRSRVGDPRAADAVGRRVEHAEAELARAVDACQVVRLAARRVRVERERLIKEIGARERRACGQRE